MNIASRIFVKKSPAKAKLLYEIRHDLRLALFDIKLNSKQVDPLVLAVNEACTNIIEHGYGKDNAGDLIIEIFYSNNELIFQITDFANPINTDDIPQRDLDDLRPRGLGIHFMREIMDEVIFSENLNFHGNLLIMKKQLKVNP